MFLLQMCPNMEGLTMSEGFKGVKDEREQLFCLENVKHKLDIIVFFLALEALFTGSKCLSSIPPTGMRSPLPFSPALPPSSNSSLAMSVVSMASPRIILVLILR